MTSTLGFALLGLLARGPRTGYELSRSLTRPISLFWHARHSQVYPELARLRDDGLVRYEVIEGPGPRDTKRYEATGAGRDALRGWLAEPAAPEPARDEFLLKVWSIHLLDPDAAVAMVEARRDAHAHQLATYRATATAMEEELGAAVDDPRASAFGEYAVLQRGIRFEEMALDWCDWLLGRLARGRASTSGGPRARRRGRGLD